MNDHQKTKQQLIEELAELRQRVAVLEAAESKRQCSEEHYRLLTEAIPQMLWWADADRQTIGCNRRWHEYTGQAPEETRGLGWLKTLHPDDVTRVTERVREALAAGAEYEAEYRIRRASDGSYRWHLSRGLPMKDEDGKITGWFGSVTDIDDQKRAEDERDRGRAILAATVECLPFEFFAIGTDGRYILQNAKLREHYGDAIGKRPEDYATDDITRQLWLDNNRRAFAGERVEGEVEARVRGEARHLYNIISPIRVDDTVYGILGVNVDITERKRAEEALRQSEQRLSLHFQQTPMGAIEWDLEFKVKRWNPGAVRIFGYSPEEALGRHASFIVSPNVREHVTQVWNDLLRRKGGERSTNENVTKNGHAVLCEWYNTPLVDANGSVIGVASLVDDVTEKKLAEEALKKAHDELEERVRERTAELSREIEQRRQVQEALAESEEKYRLLVETTGTGYVILDGLGRVIDANAEYVRISGHRTLEEILGRTVVEWTAPYDLERNAAEVEKCYRQGLVRQLEIAYLHPDGTIVPIDINATCLDTEKGRRIVCLCRDISDRRQAQQALRQSHDELQAIYDQVADGIIIVDAEKANPIRVNTAFCRMVGYDRVEVYSVSPERLHPPEVLPAVWEHLQAVKKGNVARIDDLTFLRKDGGIVYLDVISRPILYNERSCWISSFHDVTEHHKSQEALEQERQSLWRMLQASDHERQIISYEIHDGLAQYLGGAIMQFQAHNALKENSPDNAKKAYETALELVRQSHAESRRLISEVRPPVIDEIGLETAIAHLVQEQRERGGPKVKLDSNVEFSRLPSILENALYRVAQEALANACKHSKSKKVKVTLTQDGQDVRLEVRDWGIGFNQETVEKGHFGLEGIRQRVRLLGGRLNIESTPDSGTLVQVVVPILEKQNEE